MEADDRTRIAGALALGAGLGFLASRYAGRSKAAVHATAATAATAAATSRATSRVRRVGDTFDPAWRPGVKQPPPFARDDLISMTPDELKGKYRFFISAFVPRPINFVSTVSAQGAVNLSPFSYSGLVCHDPPTVVFSCVDKNRGGGDTLQNVKATREFVTHIMSEWYLESANHTCGNFEPDVNEFDEAALTMVASDLVRPPRCAESAVQLECRVESIHDIDKDAADGGGPSCTMVVGRVVKVHVNRAVYDEDNGVVVAEALRPMSRLGGNTYGTLGDIFDLARPTVGGRAAEGGAGAKGT